LDCQALQVLAAEVRRPVELTSNDRKALQAWVDHLVDEKQSFSATDPGFELERRGREILERLLGR
jgi:hypothetical protein